MRETRLETILVTGGAGFIGSHLCERLLADHHRVVCLDNLSTGFRRNIEHLEGNPEFYFVEADLRAGIPLEWQLDKIFHLASPASPVAYDRIPVETAMVNAAGTYNVLERARRERASVLIASTSEIYGDPLIHPQREDYWGNVNSVGPRSPYDEGKRFAEALGKTYLREFDVDVRIVRIFNTYGPRSDPDDGRMIPNFIRQALEGQPLTIYGNGSQTRSLCYVDDLVEGLMRTMFTPGAKGAVINLGCPDERTVRNVAVLIKEICKSASEIVSHPAREEEPSRRCPDVGRALKLLGWEARTPLSVGLELTSEWFRQELSHRQPAGNMYHGAGG